jgi:hypothetical protein
MNAPKPPFSRPPLFVLIFMSLFGFIGVTLLGFLWFGTERDFPPLIFKILASFIALGFITMGFGAPLSALRARQKPEAEARGPATAEPSEAGYKCPNCGAGLGQQEVSPSGDVKCRYCLKWWNIHR